MTVALVSVLSAPWRRRTSVVEMARSASASFLGSEFNDFLFAPIGEDRTGMLLTVLSALARRDLDPWKAAAELAGLPEETAIQRLVSLISTLPRGLSPRTDPRTIAAGAVALLPCRADLDVARREMLFGTGAAANPGVFAALVIFIGITLSAHYILTHRQPAGVVVVAHASSSSPVFPKKTSPISGK
jgi:hypothetical protein